jgi:hypothetical protein
MSDGSTIQPVFDGNAVYLLDLIFKLKKLQEHRKWLSDLLKQGNAADNFDM